MIERYRRLRRGGVLGLNRRNSRYIAEFNPRRLYPLVDDKLRTKELAIAAGMAVPELYGVISTQHDVRRLEEMIGGREQFVVKPAHGSGGNGILVITGRSKDAYRKSSGTPLSAGSLAYHISSAVSGLYSLGGQRDKVLLEYCVQFDPLFAKVSFQGVPDIRVIVLRGYPVMAMVRLPTRSSDGKANLHQGAVGVGIDLETGITSGGVQGSSPVDAHPDTGEPVSGLQIPHWGEILELSARCWEMTGLGYLGVDLVLDRDLGPLILELNARPGLNIQIANERGLGRRLTEVEKRTSKPAAAEERVHFSRQHLAGL